MMGQYYADIHTGIRPTLTVAKKKNISLDFFPFFFGPKTEANPNRREKEKKRRIARE